MLFSRNLFIVFVLLFMNACATPLPRPVSNTDVTSTFGSDSGNALFKRTLAAHGGEFLSSLNDVNLSVTGKWGLIPAKVMPKVADQFYRISSQEHYLPNKGIYSAFYNGPAGTKKVLRTPQSISVFYNGEKPTDRTPLSVFDGRKAGHAPEPLQPHDDGTN